jgi:hypothetical protein
MIHNTTSLAFLILALTTAVMLSSVVVMLVPQAHAAGTAQACKPTSKGTPSPCGGKKRAERRIAA